jgi:hypothetical protein
LGMPNDLKTERVPVLMSADELRAVDDWRFEHRIGSRGEAIRSLVRHGITATTKPGAPSVESGSARPPKRRR